MWGDREKEGGREGEREREYYHIRSCGIVELLNTVQIGLRITLVSKTERERPQLIHEPGLMGVSAGEGDA